MNIIDYLHINLSNYLFVDLCMLVLLGHTTVGLDAFSMEATFNLFYTGLNGNAVTSTNKGILPSKILSQVPDQKTLPWQVDQPNSSTVELVDQTYDSQRVMAGHIVYYTSIDVML